MTLRHPAALLTLLALTACNSGTPGSPDAGSGDGASDAPVWGEVATDVDASTAAAWGDYDGAWPLPCVARVARSGSRG